VSDRKILLGGFCGEGGLTVALQRLALGLKAKGEDVEVVLKIVEGGDDSHVRSCLEDAGIRVWTLNHGTAPSFSNYLKRVFELRSVIKKVNPTVVNFHYGGIFPWGSEFLAAKLAGVRRIFGSHHGWISSQTRKVSFQRKLDGLLACRMSNGFVFLLEEQRQCFIEIYGKQKHMPIILNGVKLPEVQIERKLARSQFGLPPEVFVIVFVGRIDGSKGVADLIQACSSSSAFLDQGYLLLAGDGDYRREYETLAEALIPNKFQFLGYRKDLDVILAAADVCALLSHHETFALAYLEAGAHGLASLSYNIPAVKEVVLNGITGFQVPKQDIGAASAAIDRLINNQELTKEMGVKARQNVSSNFSLDRSVTAYLELFTDLN